MAHPRIDCEAGFVFEPLFLTDEDGRPVLTALTKAAFEITDSTRLAPAEEQQPVNLEGELWGDPEQPSYKYEPEASFVKLGTDVVLIGQAHAPPGTQVIDVGLKVGPVQKIVRVFGDRYWVKTGGRVIATPPQPFERMPLVYERAFGGWDKAGKDEREWTFEPRNPVGRGFGDPLRYVEEGKVPMPNLEDPGHLIKRYGDRPPPAGFGFISPNWQPRAQYAGTYDEAWDRERRPLLPVDFDRRFFNAASPGLIVPGYLEGKEEVIVVNAAHRPRLRFELPGLPPPTCRVELRGGKKKILSSQLDTVVIDTEAMRVFLTWRTYTPVANGPQDVLSVRIAAEREVGETALA